MKWGRLTDISAEKIIAKCFPLFRTYYHFMTLEKLTGSTADTYLEYIQRNLPEGVSMKVCNNLLFFLNIVKLLAK